MTQLNIFELIGMQTGNLPNLRASDILLDRGLTQFVTIAIVLVREQYYKAWSRSLKVGPQLTMVVANVLHRNIYVLWIITDLLHLSCAMVVFFEYLCVYLRVYKKEHVGFEWKITTKMVQIVRL